MKLKRLDIHGFKSFYHRTTVAFDEGITAVVGPNGCGKSNIVDSIKWVMGEQGAKSLRGSVMDDIIFAGSERRGPMGLCEVRLTFTNDGSVQVPARWAEVDEIAIERRLERSKGSGYLLNKQRCRLADIQELVAGTGIGSGPGGQRAYAIIEQGQIGRIVGAKANERRLLIEEAAGITRYRNRKRLAERKMKETRLNLERVDDIVGEIEVRLRSLNRQAKKAERFRAYQDEALGIAKRVAVFEYQVVQKEHTAIKSEVNSVESGESGALRAVEIAEVERAAVAIKEKIADEAARMAAARVTQAETERRVAEHDQQSLEREARTLAQQLESLRADLESGASLSAQLNTEAVEAEAALTELHSGEEEEVAALVDAEATRKIADKSVQEARSVADSVRRQAAQEAQTIARARAEQAGAERRVRELGQGIVGLDRQHAELLELQAGSASRAETAEASLLAATTEIESAREAREAARHGREQAGTALDAAILAERGVVEALIKRRSRLQSLEELEKARVGLGKGSKVVLDSKIEGILGLVPGFLEVPAEYETAVAAALGERLKGIVVSDLGGAQRAIELLRKRGKGRGVFVRQDGQPGEQKIPQAEGVLGLLADLVGGELDRTLLGEALLVDDLDAATRATNQGWTGVVVTRDGTRLDGTVAVVGGAAGADAAPLSRRREIKMLQGEVKAGQRVVDEAAETVVEARKTLKTAREQLDIANRAVHAGELRQAEARKDVSRAKNEVEQLVNRLKRLAQSKIELEKGVTAAQAEGVAARERADLAESKRIDRDREIEAANEQITVAEASRDEAVAALHQARTIAVARKERVNAARAALERLRRQQAEVASRTKRAAENRVRIERRLSELAIQRVEAEQKVATCEADAEGLATKLAAARIAYEEQAGKAKAATAQVEIARKAREVARDALSDGRLQLQARSLRLEHLAEQALERFKRSMALLIEEVRNQPPPTDEERDRLKQLEALIEKMGEVNVHAIEEHAEVVERHTFLTEQRQDLLDALADLETAIDQINQTSKKLFKETFEAVDGHFRLLFPRLFRGGAAKLELTDPTDLLNTGIEMRVQPPGKKVQSVTLLSGGEKAMCAIALVFAVFRVKPSPFCLLDEVDAPLDDANIGRFNEIVREMAQTSQILLITHNKRTMEIADVLYGITMEESGISKLVSVRMT